MKKLWEENARKEYVYWQTQDNGYNCIGKTEPLRGNLSGYYSIRIDSKNRIVFRIINDNIEIIQCGTHYQEK